MRMVGFKAQARRIGRFARRFARSNSGNIAIIYALTLIPLLTAIGGAVDLSRALLAEQRLANALDATALAVGANEEADEDELEILAQNFFNANYPDELIGTPGPIELSIDDGIVNIAGTTQLDTTLLSLIDIHHIDVAATSQVVRESKSLEVVLVLDNTGSMGSHGKIQALRSASHILVDTLFGEESVHPKLKIGLVPFSQAVNVGSWNEGQFWIDSTAQSPIHGENFEGYPGSPANIFDLYDEITDKSWNGCVETRPEPLDELDTPPSGAIGQGATLWVPYFYPDEPGGRGDADRYYANSYLDDDVPGWMHDKDDIKMDLTKYDHVNAWEDGPHYGCYVPPITPLTNVKADLHDAIDDFIANGYTHIPIGLAWGWRVVSPGEPYTEGAAYNDPETNKAIVLLTDGENTIQRQNTHNESYYSAYGYVDKGRLGTTNYWTAVAQLDPKTAAICENVKEENIRLYTITFDLNDGPIKNLMRNCATETSLYYDSPSVSQLESVFAAIAKDLSNLRISR